ncbi:MAG: phosphopantothenate/pantothenate synthetase [Methanobacterium sp.]|uniref:4-phosphopantoate--beta-alanine ligase n=1 Tax=Methanobacterium sp. TaxID=2164 RepID=UPI003D65DDB7|nr:phosphopantothenate/pantothenate synthetase [Methanobacterium sp.]
MINKDHPRYESLKLRDKIVEAYKSGILADAGMIAHGRGEAFDYLIGEKTTQTSLNAIESAAAALLLANNPVISINGNATALVAEKIVDLAHVLNAKIEINLFYRTPQRVKAIEKILKEHGAHEIMGTEDNDQVQMEDISSHRGKVSHEGIYKADVVLVPLEDGDRTEALVKEGKFVIAIDLNPLSRTSKTASITIVDNITRIIPCLISEVSFLKKKSPDELKKIVCNFNNARNLEESLKVMLNSIKEFDSL